MNQKPYFSVIIPTLNEEDYLPTILKSLSKQTYFNFELLIVDGESKDDTKKVFDKYSPFFSTAAFIPSDKANVGYQRNLGAKMARGEYLVFFDADVDIGKTFFEEVYAASKTKKFFLATTWMIPDSDKKIDVLMTQFANLLAKLAKSVNRQFSGGYNTIVKREVFLKIKGFRDDLTIGEDHDFSIRASEIGVECMILKDPKVVVSFRRLRSEGTLNILRKYTYCQIYSLLRGPITKEIFEYKMGGDAHKKRKKKIALTKFNTYLSKLDKIEKKISNLFDV